MKLTDIFNDPNASWLYMEQFVNGGTRSYSSFASLSEVDPRYQPWSGNRSFLLPVYDLPLKTPHAIMISAKCDERLLQEYAPGSVLRMPVHPEALSSVQKDLAAAVPSFQIEAIPTASTRTVGVGSATETNLPFHFLKLHLPKRISRFNRRLRKSVIEFCIQLSQELLLDTPPHFTFLPEMLGGMGGEEGWGYIARSASPFPASEGVKALIPLFSLAGKDIHHPDDETVLAQLIAYHHADPLQFTLRHIIGPLIHSWCSAATHSGILLEAHGQNTLLEVGVDLVPGRIVHRDLDVYVDQYVRTEQGRDNSWIPDARYADHAVERAKMYSLVYDSFLGHHLLGYLTRFLEDRYGIDPRSVQQEASNVFARAFSGKAGLFSRTRFYYKDILFEENGWELADTGELPLWRPALP